MGILPHVPKQKDKAKGKEAIGRPHEDVVYWIGEDADNCVVFRKHQAAPLGYDTSCLKKCPNWLQVACIAGLQD